MRASEAIAHIIDLSHAAPVDVRFAGLVVALCIAAACAHARSDGDLSPTDISALRQASRECGLHERTLTFARNAVGGYDIQINRAYGDPENKIECAFQRLPDEVEMKFGVGSVIVTVPD